MTIIKGFNQNPPNTKYAKGAFAKAIGEETMLFLEGKHIGFAKIVEVETTDDGVYFTFETDAEIGLSLDVDLVTDLAIDFDT